MKLMTNVVHYKDGSLNGKMKIHKTGAPLRHNFRTSDSGLLPIQNNQLDCV